MGEEAPIDEATIAKVRIIGAFCDQVQDALHQGLGLRGGFKEDFDGGREELQLDLGFEVGAYVYIWMGEGERIGCIGNLI